MSRVLVLVLLFPSLLCSAASAPAFRFQLAAGESRSVSVSAPRGSVFHLAASSAVNVLMVADGGNVAICGADSFIESDISCDADIGTLVITDSRDVSKLRAQAIVEALLHKGDAAERLAAPNVVSLSRVIP